MSNSLKLNIQNTFTQELPADPIETLSQRQVSEACFSYVEPKKTKDAKLLIASQSVADNLGLSAESIQSEDFLKVFSGNKILEDSRPYAMCYGGHQFGHWAGQLGDGRAINLGEVVFKDLRWAIQLKGAGQTPYSRTADGFAVLRSSVREYLCSEAMFHLNVPTTRALCLVETGDQVLRDILYNGNPAYEKGAIVTRVAPSFIRFGNFEIFAARQDTASLKTLADYTIKHFYSELENQEDKYTAFFKEVAYKTLEMIIHWQRVGFVHGVMNTDNLSILGLTIDYGPYGWLEDYNQDWTPNTTDNQHKRYRFGNQPQIAQWNLVKLANALYPLAPNPKPFQEILDQWKIDYENSYYAMMKSKLGLNITKNIDQHIITDLEENLSLTETDMTIFFRLLADLDLNTDPKSNFKKVEVAFYKIEEVEGMIYNQWMSWFTEYQDRLTLEPADAAQRKQAMNLVNPKYVLRNYMAQVAIDAAEKDDYSILHELDKVLQFPYEEQIDHQKWFAKRPDWAKDKIGCSALSCSS